ncbi:MAG TPA: hypothetical protein VEK08_11240 [Planctomycetota bacterium]|nr:hypothetical protein [Planctomycetota bacterium]
MFLPNEPHLTVALVLGGGFGQFADPLDWIARGFGLDLKVDRQQLMESLAERGGGVASKAAARALGSDKRTRFQIQLFGRCEGKLVALCGMTINPRVLTLKVLEERATELAVLNERSVLGIQATHGKLPETLEGIANPEAVMRVYPLNILGRAFFEEKIELIEKDRKLKVLDAGSAVVIKLAKPWLFYDVPRSGRRAKKPLNLLPF